MLDPIQNPDFALAETTSAQMPTATDGVPVLTLAERSLAWLREHWQIICLVLIFLSMHFYVLSIANGLIYDEHFWVPEAKHILDREPLDWPEYPALSKLFIGSGIHAFGDNSWGWRVPSVVFGAISVGLVYLIARKLAGKRTALLASLLLVFENITFTMTGLAMLDVFALPFMLLSFLLYLNGRYATSGLALALGVVCSPKALLGVAAILGHWFLTRRKRGFPKVAVFAVTALLGFFVLMPLTDFLATGQWLNPFGRISEMWLANTSLGVSQLTTDELRWSQPQYPWWWIMDPRGLSLMPNKFHHMIMITPTIWILIVPAIVYLVYRYFFVRKGRNTPRFILLWFGATYLLWIPLALLTDRPMFLYYLFPTMGAICIAVGYAMHRAWQKSSTAKDKNLRWLGRALITLYLFVHILVFILVSPLTAGLAET